MNVVVGRVRLKKFIDLLHSSFSIQSIICAGCRPDHYLRKQDIQVSYNQKDYMLNGWILSIIDYFKLDFWTLWGLFGQGFFFLRLIIQWLRSEKEGKTMVPLNFWWLGMVGAVVLMVYAFIRRDIVFILTSALQMVIYYRNFVIALKSRGNVISE